MIAVVTGSRSITDYALVSMVLERCWFDITALWHGAQAGVKIGDEWFYTPDRLAAKWAKSKGIPVREFPADWDKHGKAAGPIRNQEMADAAVGQDAFLVKIWDGSSAGTADCAKRFAKLGITIYEYNQLLGKYGYLLVR